MKYGIAFLIDSGLQIKLYTIEAGSYYLIIMGFLFDNYIGFLFDSYGIIFDCKFKLYIQAHLRLYL